MSKSNGVLVTWYGIVYRMSKRNYKRMLEAVARGEGYNLSAFGAKNLGQSTNITDLDEGTAKDLLAAMTEGDES